jgi:hypothetical protein
MQVLEGPLFPGWNQIKSGCFMPRTRIPLSSIKVATWLRAISWLPLP